MLWIIGLGVFVSAVLHIHADYSNRRVRSYIFKPLTTLLIILFAYLQIIEVSILYRNLILAGLVFSLAGDIFLMLPGDKFIAGLASFLVAHIFYIAAFVSVSGWHLSILYLLPILLYGGILLKTLLPHTGSQSMPVIVYAFALLLLLWQTLGRSGFSPTHSALIALVGTLFFVASDSILAINRFAKKFGFAQLAVMGTYYLAQFLIAASI